MKSLIKRYQIPAFFVLTLIIGWFPWYTGRNGIIIVAPTFAGLIMAGLVGGKDGLLAIFRRMTHWRVHIRWYLLILLIPLFTSLVAVGIHILFGGTALQFPLFKQNQHLILLTFVFYLLPWQSSACLEEIGFRGYAQEEVQKRWSPLTGTLILDAFFGAWLLPEFIRPDSNQYAMGGLRFFP